ncbi:MAG: hypothetical protein KME11_04700 [Timaviella obliquedivisa GSE-PSE-MK23-08B]|jgi:hypothetical protein|nr:hypothetical protein [Timaviella obliquedivisa GSE-PSE-MK23-08B]
MISRQEYNAIDPASPEQRSQYARLVLNEIKETRSEFIGDAELGIGFMEYNIRPVVEFRWGLSGWVKRLSLQPFVD